MTAQTSQLDDGAPMYSLFIEFARSPEDQDADVGAAARILEQFEGVLDEIRGEGIEVRGLYDLTGFSDRGAVLVWLRGPEADELQWAQRQLRRTMLLTDLKRVSAWIVAEITLIDEAPLGWLNVAAAVEAPYLAPDSGADFDGYYDDVEPEDGDVEAPGDESADEDAGALVSLFARIGVGEVGFVIAAEADAPISLIGDLGRPFGDDLDLEVRANSSVVGRWVAPAELFEVLR